MYAGGSEGTVLKPSGNSGFTLVEMLVTMVAFSLALSSLVYAFRAGAKTYQTISSHQVSEAAYNRVETLLTEDLRGVTALEKDKANLLAQREADGRSRLMFHSLEGYRHLRVAPRCVCRTVEYAMDYDEESGRKVFVRRTSSRLPVPAQQEEPEEEILLQEVKDVRFLFLHEREWEEGWEDAKKLPASVGVEIVPDRGKPVMFAIAVPQAVLGESE